VSRRLGVLATIILLLFAVVAVQAANVQFFRAPSLVASPINPRIVTASVAYPRGDIYAADGTVLAHSVAQSSSFYPYRRVYPLGALTAGVIGFSGPVQGDWALENEYSKYLTAHPLAPQSFAQLLSPTAAADSITLTLLPKLQQIARNALAGQDGAAVVLDPRSGAVLAMYSNPTYNPAPLASPVHAVAAAAWKAAITNNGHGFPPLGLVATQQTFPPGSTFKIVTTAAAVLGRPDLLVKSYPYLVAARLPNTDKKLKNSGGSACGGVVAVMLPQSCDPGYALLGLDIGANLMTSTADRFGYNQDPPIDLPGVVKSYFPPAASFSNNLPGLAYSAIGQENVRSTALQNALVAAAIANGGAEMTPHFLDFVTAPNGSKVFHYQPKTWLTPLTSTQAAQIVPLMQGVVQHGTASGVGFLQADDVAAKTGTAQVGNGAQNTDDWMIAFAPATKPTVAVAVVMPFQATSAFGSTVAGPIVKCLIEGALALQSGQPPTGTASTCLK
jgi:peptidoglycan glycosyltransferase